MSTAASASLMATLRQLESLLKSRPISEFPPPLLMRIKTLKDSFPIEFSELRASSKQLAFQKAFFERKDGDRRCDVFAALGGNRSGKSRTAGWLCFAKFIRDFAQNGDSFWCVAQTLDRSIGGQQKDLWDALPRWMFGNQLWTEKLGFSGGNHGKILLPTSDGGKCLIEFRSADQALNTFEQAKLRGVWCDEKIYEALYASLLARIVDLDGFLLYSDKYEQFWQFERLVEAKPEAGIFCQLYSMFDNAHNLPASIIERRLAQMSTDEAKNKIYGILVAMEGVVYKEFSDTPACDDKKKSGHKQTPFPIPPSWPRWRVIDYGGSAPTACTWIAIGPTEEAFIYREYYQTNLSVGKNAAAIIAMSGDEQYVRTYMDPHAVDKPPAYYGASKTISQQYADAGIRSVGWPFVNVMGEHALVQRVKFRLESKTLFVFDTCTNTRREFRSWKYKTDKDGKPLAADAFENGNNHLLDCIKGFFGTNPCFTVRAKVEVFG